MGEIVHLRTDDYPGLPEAIEAAAPKLGARPRSMIVCGAGPVVGRTLKLTNAPWVMDGPETARRTGLEPGVAAQRFRGAGALAAGDPGSLGEAHRSAQVRRRRARR